MNLARVPIDEESGKVLGLPEPVTVPSPHASGISFALDGKSAVYVQRFGGYGIHKIGFDARDGKIVDTPEPVSRGSRDGGYLDISADGELLAFNSTGKEDIYIMRTDGSGIRQLTGDEFKDFAPSFSPDGKRLTFMTNRQGVYNLWLINTDGSGVRQLTQSAKSTANPIWSPDGKRIGFFVPDQGAYTVEVDKPWTTTSMVPLPRIPGQEGILRPERWSADGTRLTVTLVLPGVMQGGVWVLDERRGTFEQVTSAGGNAVWLSDEKRVIFQNRGKLFLANLGTKQIRDLLDVTPYEIERDFALSPDNRTIYFIKSVIEEDLWLMRLP
jgi:Tol biopolymer transport system component